MTLPPVIFRRSAAVIIGKMIVAMFIVSVLYSLFNITHLYTCEILELPFYTISGRDLMGYASLMIVYVLVGVFFLLQWSRDTYEIRSGEVIHVAGVFRSVHEHYPLQAGQHIEIRQTFFGRMFRFGTIVITHPLLKNTFRLPKVADPESVVPLLQSCVGNAPGAATRTQ